MTLFVTWKMGCTGIRFSFDAPFV